MPHAPWVLWAKGASPSVGALVKTLAHRDPYVRVYAAEALASIGPNAAKATNALVEALGDPMPAFDGRRVRPSEASARLRSLPCRS
jgi:HEAT repeat protein